MSSVFRPTEHKRPQYLSSSLRGRPQSVLTFSARSDMLYLVSTRNQTVCPATLPGRYSAFPPSGTRSFAMPIIGNCIHRDGSNWPFPIHMNMLTGGMSDTPCPPSFYAMTPCGLLTFRPSKASNVGRGLVLLRLCSSTAIFVYCT